MDECEKSLEKGTKLGTVKRVEFKAKAIEEVGRVKRRLKNNPFEEWITMVRGDIGSYFGTRIVGYALWGEYWLKSPS